MRILGLFFLLLWTAGSAHAQAPVRERLLYAAKESTEAWLSFDFYVDYSASNGGERSARRAIDNQIQHLYGPMGEADYVAVPKNRHEISNIRVESQGGRYFRAHYSYRGMIALQNGPNDFYEVVLPIRPSQIYNDSLNHNGYNPCTDEHYQSQGDFWYFWNPYRSEECRSLLREGEHYARVSGRVARIPNTQLTYPEYARLIRRGTDGGRVIRMDVLYGMDDPSKGRDPWSSDDINATNFRSLVQMLRNRGYRDSRVWSRQDFQGFIGLDEGSYSDPYVMELSKSTPAGIRLVTRIFFGPSGFNEDSSPFHFFLKNAMETASVFIYSGHSGLGAHLDIAAIEDRYGFRIQPSRNLYQIYFINGCTTYSYYNEMFFERKATEQDPTGSRNLDVITNGLATYFSVIDTADFYLFDAVTNWADGRGALSYQRLADATDTNNLYGVNGDEDNPTTEDHPSVLPPR
jgi:hypothetical protein